MQPIDKTYQPQDIEQHWYQIWETNHYFQPQGSGKPYCIVVPPPNVTGSLHMGHGFGTTLVDVLIRYHRMCGDKTLWQTGMDHAGIATQMVVERKLNLEGKTRLDLGREKFVEKIWEWKNESGGNITRQFRRLGASMDWTRERFTFDEDFSHAVREVFIQLYKEGLIYRGKRLINWDPVLQTAISDLEVINEEEDGFLWFIRYPIVNSKEYVVIATTRPETLLGDVAVAVNPDDERYSHLIGNQVHLPLTDRVIPVIADRYVDPLFGTGCLKITPAHDFNDYTVALRHNLSLINIFSPTAHLNENVPSQYQHLERFQAREQIIKDLESKGYLEKIEKYKLKIPRGEKTGAIIEPFLTHQWFMKMKPLAKPAIEAVQKGEVKFIPENWTKTYFQWLNNIEDWCISRQLWWGHRIPVWYDAEGNIYVGHNEEEVRKQYQLPADLILKQEEDVLDTWFSASLWPFSSLGWPNKMKDNKIFFPTDVLVTGFDIIFFWVARMIMMSLKFMQQVPFKEVYITGLIRDSEGHKMSKSKGNVLDPIDLIDGISLENLIKKRTYGLMQPRMAQKIEKTTIKEFPEGIPSFGTDALRLTFCSFASFTREIRFDINRLAGYRNFCNKLWNASRYVLMNTETNQDLSDQPKSFSLPDRWITSKLQHTIELAHLYLKQYRFDLFAQTLYEFIWDEFCDWYLELSKPILTSHESTPEQLRGTRYTLVTVLETILRLLHPIMPYITEEIWQRIAPIAGKTGKTIMLQPYPQKDPQAIDEQAERELEWIKAIVSAIRTIRSEMNISPSKQLTILFRKGTASDKEISQKQLPFLKTLAKLKTVEWLAPNETPPFSATAVKNELEIFIPMAGFINKAEEIQRLNKEITKLQKDLTQIENKLNNPNFIDRAPAEIINKEKNKQAELNNTIKKLQQQMSEMDNLP